MTKTGPRLAESGGEIKREIFSGLSGENMALVTVANSDASRREAEGGGRSFQGELKLRVCLECPNINTLKRLWDKYGRWGKPKIVMKDDYRILLSGIFFIVH